MPKAPRTLALSTPVTIGFARDQRSLPIGVCQSSNRTIQQVFLHGTCQRASAWKVAS